MGICVRMTRRETRAVINIICMYFIECPFPKGKYVYGRGRRQERTERQMTSITNESEYATIAIEVEMQSWT